MDTLEQTARPLNAAQIFETLDGGMDLTTVYRGLEFLEREGFLRSFVFECRHRGIERYFYADEELHRHFFHCEDCHRFFAMKDCPVDGALERIEEETGFTVRDHQLILKGECGSCKERRKYEEG